MLLAFVSGCHDDEIGRLHMAIAGRLHEAMAHLRELKPAFRHCRLQRAAARFRPADFARWTGGLQSRASRISTARLDRPSTRRSPNCQNDQLWQKNEMSLTALWRARRGLRIRQSQRADRYDLITPPNRMVTEWASLNARWQRQNLSKQFIGDEHRQIEAAGQRF
jgi:hypothetical protein